MRHGFTGERSFSNAGPDLLAGTTTDMLLDYMAIRLNGPHASPLRLRVGLEVTDDRSDATVERFLLVIENGVLRYTPPFTEAPETTLRVTRTALAALAHGTATLDALVEKGDARADGDRTVLDTLLGLLDTFTAAFDVVVPNLR
ncbi:alkyl sulfatase C-terminal domain-containing protein [Streptomyces sp. NPDC102274]|uniref:alkyl sulfatase C-terminal domain-containing protein n=1 Tax=Streptomyces sp. NPDC102274 TaxID=3366151 RepID=UPI003805761E